ncbi:hypothetical protein NE172_06290 [Clostridium botulinum]|uniref:Uncharacterized protein n=1 Tax=Clostridium botulinum TaxID=1491 RepID=A0A6B4JKU1_CLOBO|nr:MULTISPECIES: hypothetical protein [Clostridium]EES50363.1 putative transposase [Clostridium botulinum E1 str. 'BoNT E Beluga']MBY6760771.1 hypothetical protein [Clostridium botulinum]MBY6919937.1 hypothetical protein [Clostridium botulinum]MCR1130557.1 hypothetical protein [Clostridium botulinum]NFJ57461.1 hypothetical protein [Clostridium botulinum]
MELKLKEVNEKINEIEEMINAIKSYANGESIKRNKYKDLPSKILNEKAEEYRLKLENLKNNATVMYNDMDYINSLINKAESKVDTTE